jgi:hypothetical protein
MKLTSRIFSTEVGVRPAEPCSVSVVATHQLLTNILQHICMTIIGNPQFRGVTGAVVTEQDLLTLERCNNDGITALERIIGVDRNGNALHKSQNETEEELRGAGNLWSEHILENVKAYMMSFVYVVATVMSGYPLISGVAKASGLTGAEWFFYIIRFFDALIYFWLPQINITIVRLYALSFFCYDSHLTSALLFILFKASFTSRTQYTSSNGRTMCGDWRPVSLGCSISRSFSEQNLCM